MLDRVRQFREASLVPDAEDLAVAHEYLAGPLFTLWEGQGPRDQRHSAGTARWLLERGHDDDHDLLVAALLHDIGKGQQRTRDRVAHVVTGWLRVGDLVAVEGSSTVMRAAIARSRTHSERGADAMAEVGAPAGAIELTRLHHRHPGANAMLALLQRADAAT